MDGLYKSAVFTLQAKYFYETGEYISRRTDLAKKLTGDDRKILSYAMGKPGNLDEKSEFLMHWCSKIIPEFKA